MHVGERTGRETRTVRDEHQALRQRPRVIEVRHEGARAEFHVHDEAVEPCRELLRQNRRRDEVDGFHRRGDVPDGVEMLVGRREIGGLADNRAAHLPRNPPEGLDVRLRDVTGDGIELVEGASRVTEAPARDHRHEPTAGRNRGRERRLTGSPTPPWNACPGLDRADPRSAPRRSGSSPG